MILVNTIPNVITSNFGEVDSYDSSEDPVYSGQPSPWATEGDSYYNAFQGMENYDPVHAPSSAQTVPDSSSEESGSPVDYNFVEYLEGLLSSVGAENEITRKFNSAEAELQRNWASSEMQKNRDWQTEMANSAYQRAVSDLKAAGLNPILAATGSASTGSGSMISGSSAHVVASGGDTLSSLLNALANVASAISDFLPSSIKKVTRAIGFR